MRSVRVIDTEHLPGVVTLLNVRALEKKTIANEVLGTGASARHGRMKTREVTRLIPKQQGEEPTDEGHAHLVKSCMADRLLNEGLA